MSEKPRCCVGAKYGDWCRNEPTGKHIFRKYYCLFHIPDKELGNTFEDAWKLHFPEYIKDSLSEGTYLDLRGIIFRDTLDLKTIVNNDTVVDISGATFHKKCIWNGASFGGLICNSTVFHKYVDLSNINTSFVHFYRSEFQEKVIFSEANVYNFHVSATLFNGDVKFNKAMCCYLSLARSRFNGHALFTKMSIGQNLNISNSDFYARVKFDNSKINNLDASDIHLSGVASFIDFTSTGETNFERALFEQSAIFQKAKLENANFIGAYSKGKIMFIEVNIEEMEFSQVNIDSFQFIDCNWPSKWGRNAAYDYIVNKERKYIFYIPFAWYFIVRFLRWIKNICKKTNVNDKVEKESETTVDQLCKLMRRLKRRALDDKDAILASDFHLIEKQCERLSAKKHGKITQYTMLNLYSLTSRYNESPLWSFFVLLILGFILFLALGHNGLTAASDAVSNGLKDIRFVGANWCGAAKVFITELKYILFVKYPEYKPATNAGEMWLLIVGRILIPIQIGFFAVSVRNRYKR